MPTIKAMHITVVDHPLAASRLTLMRDERSDNATFRAALADLGTMLIYEASRHLDVEHFDTTAEESADHCSSDPGWFGYGGSGIVYDS